MKTFMLSILAILHFIVLYGLLVAMIYAAFVVSPIMGLATAGVILFGARAMAKHGRL